MKTPDKIKQYWLSYLAALIALTALGFSLLRVIPCEITTETYIGILVSILAVIVAFVVGFQIWNVLKWESELKRVDELKKELTEIKEELLMVESQFYITIYHDSARKRFEEGAFIQSFLYSLATLYHSLIIGDSTVIKMSLSNAKDTLETSINKHQIDKSSDEIYIMFPELAKEILTPKEHSKALLDVLISKCSPKSQYFMLKNELLEIKKIFDENYDKIRGINVDSSKKK